MSAIRIDAVAKVEKTRFDFVVFKFIDRLQNTFTFFSIHKHIFSTLLLLVSFAFLFTLCGNFVADQRLQKLGSLSILFIIFTRMLGNYHTRSLFLSAKNKGKLFHNTIVGV